MDKLQSLVNRIIDTVPMSEADIWALKGSTTLGAMVYSKGSAQWWRIFDDHEELPHEEELYALYNTVLSIEQHKPETT